MNEHMKTKLKCVVAIAALGWCVSNAHAAVSDTMVVSVTPSVTYSVSITSAMTGGYQFGTVAMGATTISTAAIIVTNDGNVSEFFTIAVSNSAPGVWVPSAASPASNQYRMMAHFNTTQPAAATFADALTASLPTNGQNLYGQGASMTNATVAKNLWLKLEMPTSMTAAVGAQTMTLTVNGQAS